MFDLNAIIRDENRDPRGTQPARRLAVDSGPFSDWSGSGNRAEEDALVA
jgi:hypothetical protein